MIAKIVKGSNFKGVVNYILDKEKDAKILVCDGLFAENKETIAGSFEAQARMNPRVTKPVGHIALAFSKEDEYRLTDRAMAGIALEYLKEMEINDTQILIVRHYDKEHPHVHIAFNRIANDGQDNQRPQRADTQHTHLQGTDTEVRIVLRRWQGTGEMPPPERAGQDQVRDLFHP